VQIPPRLQVDIVEEKTGNVPAVNRLVPRRNHMQICVLVSDAASVDLADSPQIRIAVDHVAGYVEADVRMLGVGGGNDDFRPRFRIHHQHIEPDRSRERALSCLARDLQPDVAIAA
jgi:hypothetical protein